MIWCKNIIGKISFLSSGDETQMHHTWVGADSCGNNWTGWADVISCGTFILQMQRAALGDLTSDGHLTLVHWRPARSHTSNEHREKYSNTLLRQCANIQLWGTYPIAPQIQWVFPMTLCTVQMYLHTYLLTNDLAFPKNGQLCKNRSNGVFSYRQSNSQCSAIIMYTKHCFP